MNFALLAGLFVTVPAGEYSVGAENRLDNPMRSVKLGAYEISKYEVTNQQFYDFVRATRYVTDAERLHNAMVFEPGLAEFKWKQDRTANWHYPNGVSRGGIRDRMNHPVTSISVYDAEQYCKWAGVRLPSLDEWEVAARAGSKGAVFFEHGAIGDYANIWHGRNHLQADLSDGYLTTSPVGSFLPNPWGLYDVYGNVFEFCAGRLATARTATSRHSRGGSWWCSKNSCCAFNSVDVGSVNPRASFSNQGFRVVKGEEMPARRTDGNLSQF